MSSLTDGSISSVKKSRASNKAYLDKLTKDLKRLPGKMVETGVKFAFMAAVSETIKFTGNAAFNWFLTPSNTPQKFYIEAQGIGPVLTKQEARLNNASDWATVDSDIFYNKKEYMIGFLSKVNIAEEGGVLMYNMTPPQNESTFKGTYSGNAGIAQAGAVAQIVFVEAAESYLKSTKWG